MARTVAIHQPQYLPYLGFFHKLARCDVFVALDDVQFQKNGIQNRNKVKASQGWQWLTVPVLHRFGQAIRDVRINADVPWQRKHVNTLVTSYSRAPYFAAFEPELKRIFEKRWEGLCELDMALIHWVMAVLHIEVPVLYSSALSVEGESTERLVNICRAVKADQYVSGLGGRRYMDLSLFERQGMRVVWPQFSSPVYDQVFPQAGFVPDLSVIDALFCCGPETRRFLE